jgi:beta-galactosidase
VDAVRLPKQTYYIYRVMQNEEPDIHIIGHWTYPTNTVKTVYVAANHCDSVELFVNGRSVGVAKQACDFVDAFGGENRDLGGTRFIYAFPKVQFARGKISAVAKCGDQIVARDEIETAGEPKALKLTSHVESCGLLADGADVAFFDVEVVDAQGRRCPTDEARVDFKLDGPAIWRGGYNSGKIGSVNNPWLDTECGINRVAIRSTAKAGKITLTATRAGLQSATVELSSRAATVPSL